MKVPFLDLSAAYNELKDEIDAATARVLASGWYIGGPEVEAFESEWAEYCQAKFCVGTGNGLDALTLALRACDIGPGDGVIVPSNTYIATWLAVSAVGATIQPVEPDPETYNITPEGIAESITPGTRAILPVHLYGQPAEIDKIVDLAQQRGLRVIEDAAQAHGAKVRGQRIGAHGDAVCWSFYPGKNLGAMGDAGAVTTNNQTIAKRIRVLGNYGSARKYVNDVRGVNSRLDPLQAAVLRAKLGVLDKWTERRRAIARLYTEMLADTDLTLPTVPDWAGPVWHLYVIQSAEREKLRRQLKDSGIGTLIHYPVAPHRQEAYTDLGIPDGSLAIAERISAQVLSIPIGPQLSAQKAQAVVAALKTTLQ